MSSSCSHVPVNSAFFRPADPRWKGSSGRCWGGRLGGVHQWHNRGGHDPRGCTKQDQSSNGHPHLNPQQVSCLTMQQNALPSLTLCFILVRRSSINHHKTHTVSFFILRGDKTPEVYLKFVFLCMILAGRMSHNLLNRFLWIRQSRRQ